MKRAMLLFCGVCRLFFGAGIGLLFAQYVGEIAGRDIFGLGISSGSVLLGMAHILGLCAGMVLCFAIGLLICTQALVRPDSVPAASAR